ncbi:hypothetical protein BDK51DRAFT_46349 [Blyttiomyces helicus]|uniref:SH3 domain-containing protein n=1 Tax=Blyttiomyces helicus TaxID=388810 RepID=A0A4P9WEA4_9FUNG|nr:hypothetical protein BDK51DRAFT_46349 [Blyttiomyces helicus]|eukprot:RKO90722.1 hypothetical protein BDK51DRAFT_46349 [Blyttiomyces helicus]
MGLRPIHGPPGTPQHQGRHLRPQQHFRPQRAVVNGRLFNPPTAHAACYWPVVNGGGGTCGSATANFPADITACPEANTWGLTYDDGPTVNVVNGVNVGDTVEIRKHLDALGVKASAIPTRSSPPHPMTSMTNEQIVAEIKYTEAFLYKTIGKIPTMWRAPYGDVDNRVRAITAALGYQTVFWTTSPDRDSTDADQAISAGQSLADGIVSTVESWFIPGPGFIELEHDIDTFTSGIAVRVLEAIQAQGSSFPLKIMPVGTCVNKPFYRDGTAAAPASGSSSSSAPPQSSTPASTNSPSSSVSPQSSLLFAPSSTSSSLLFKSSLSLTSTVGIAVGCVAGGFLIAVLAMYLLWRHRRGQRAFGTILDSAPTFTMPHDAFASPDPPAYGTLSPNLATPVENVTAHRALPHENAKGAGGTRPMLSTTGGSSFVHGAMAVARAAHSPKSEDELALRIGERVIVEEVLADGWAKGRIVEDGREGVFPYGAVVHTL